jgi:hypothetical protein
MSFKPNNTGFSFVELLISMLLVGLFYAVVSAQSGEEVPEKKFADCAEHSRKMPPSLASSLVIYSAVGAGGFSHSLVSDFHTSTRKAGRALKNPSRLNLQCGRTPNFDEHEHI